MRKLIAITLLAGLALASQGQAGFMKTWAFPNFSGTDNNPYTDVDGNTWGAYLAARDDKGANLTPLAWSGSVSGYDGRWQNGNAQYWPNAYGGWNGTPKIRGGYSDVGALTFSPGVDGVYDLTGDAFFYRSSSNSTICFQIYKISGGSTTELYNVGQTGADTLIFADFPALQNIALTTADRLVFLAQSQGSGDYGEVRLTNAGLGLVPEPASLGLLALGALALARRRR